VNKLKLNSFIRGSVESLQFFIVETGYLSKETIFDLVAATAWKAFLDDFPVLAVRIYEVDKLHVLLQGPF
jgi:hypothetical protein